MGHSTIQPFGVLFAFAFRKLFLTSVLLQFLLPRRHGSSFGATYYGTP